MAPVSKSGNTNPPSVSDSLTTWLEWLETIHPVSIDMGLDRVSLVADKLQLRPALKPLVLVGGTNGKGSTVAMLSKIYTDAGYRVGSYTSPHIHDFRERICVDGVMAGAQEVVSALAFVESGRIPETLTYFEYTTLAAMHVFNQNNCDVLIFEVGLGGRLDATNLWDADCSVVTSIALDHEDYLGSDLSVIATEKAAIGRPGRLLVVGDAQPPLSLFKFAEENDISINHVGVLPETSLPECNLAGEYQRRNAACAAAVVSSLQNQLSVSNASVKDSLQHVSIPARFEQIDYPSQSVLFDVAHNPAGAQALVSAWQEKFDQQRAQVIFACLVDKDLPGLSKALTPIVAQWHCVTLDVDRALSSEALVKGINTHGSHQEAIAHPSIRSACTAAILHGKSEKQPILVAGSFHTIGKVRLELDQLLNL